jgi:membrane protease YdiL (CAAX protease family)
MALRFAPDVDVRLPLTLGGTRAGTALAFLVAEVLAFAIIPLSDRFPLPWLLALQAAIAAILLGAAQACRFSERAAAFQPVLYALFTGGAAVFLSTHFSDRLLDGLPFTAASPAWIAWSTFAQSAWRVVPAILLVAAGGGNLRSLYLTGGRLRMSLAIGAAGFAAFAVGAFVPVVVHGGGARLVALWPWILLFVFSGGFADELLFRGLLLRQYERILGAPLSNLVVAAAFTLVHLPAAAAGPVGFPLILFPLALGWGYLVQRTDSLWGAVLLHAGADCLLVFGVYLV